VGRFITREVIGLMTLSVVLFLVLTHSQGFARSIRAGGATFSEITRTLQGR
jgi:hypothetical protein